LQAYWALRRRTNEGSNLHPYPGEDLNEIIIDPLGKLRRGMLVDSSNFLTTYTPFDCVIRSVAVLRAKRDRMIVAIDGPPARI